MQLERVEIKQFRSIESIDILFDPKCRILVGVNEAGKSNILRAISLIDPTKKTNQEDLRDSSSSDAVDPEDSLIKYHFSLSSGDRKKIRKMIAAKIFGNSDMAILKGPSGSITLNDLLVEQDRVILRVQVWPNDRSFFMSPLPSNYTIHPNLYEINPENKDQFVTRADGTQELLGSYRFNLSAEPPTANDSSLLKPNLSSLSLFLNEIYAEYAAQNLPACVFWNYQPQFLLPGKISLKEFLANPNICAPLKEMFALAGVSEIQDTITREMERQNGLKNLLNRVGVASTKHLHSIWGEYKHLKIALSKDGDNIEAVIADEINSYNLDRRSDGFKRFITFLLMISSRVRTSTFKNSILLYDEPDVSLHPSGARHLRNELLRISEQNVVVFSTHSIFMIDKERVDRHLIVKKIGETTSVTTADLSEINDEEVIYNALGFSFVEMVKEINFVFEGRRDKILFEVGLRRVKDSAPELFDILSQAGLCFVKGIKDIKRITPLLELANRKCFILSDSDDVALESQKKYDGYGRWITYGDACAASGALTGEDFVELDRVLETANKVRQKHPNFPKFELTDFSGKAVIATISASCNKTRISKEDAKELINIFKELLFEGLQTTHLRAEYDSYLVGLAKAMGAAPSGAVQLAGQPTVAFLSASGT